MTPTQLELDSVLAHDLDLNARLLAQRVLPNLPAETQNLVRTVVEGGGSFQVVVEVAMTTQTLRLVLAGPGVSLELFKTVAARDLPGGGVESSGVSSP